MIDSIAELYQKRFDKNHYNCAHFVCDAWQVLVGEPISERLKCFLLPLSIKYSDKGLRRDFVKLSRPESPCLVLFSAPKTSPHAGLFFGNKVLHLTENGVFYEYPDQILLSFKTVRYYK